MKRKDKGKAACLQAKKLLWKIFFSSSVIRQKGESKNGCFKKIKRAKFSEKRTFLTPWYAHVCVSGGKKCSYFGKFGVLCFLETPVFRFALLLYYRWVERRETSFKSERMQTRIWCTTRIKEKNFLKFPSFLMEKK